MKGNFKGKVYWANALFSEADRSFNIACVTILRQAGYEVFLPQDADVNEDFSPTAENIFRVDTSELFNSDVVVACLDQESIDAGVACEVGVAVASGIPVIGLYTDIRQFRQGSTRMYKNPYVIGAIESIGNVVSNASELPGAIEEVLKLRLPFYDIEEATTEVSQFFSSVASEYSDYVEKLESWYSPSFKSTSIIHSYIEKLGVKNVIDFGCGPGLNAHHITSQFPDIQYIGYDISETMLELSRKRVESSNALFVSNLSELKKKAKTNPFDFVIAFFTLHDHPSQAETLEIISSLLKYEGHFLILDLSDHDLPHLTKRLLHELAVPRTDDLRMNPTKLKKIASEFSLSLIEYKYSIHSIEFPNITELDSYLAFFGIYKGMDLPLWIRNDTAGAWRQKIRRIIESWEYPFKDDRMFSICLLRKQ